VTEPVARVVWVAFIVIYVILRMRPQWLARKAPIRYSARDAREIALLGVSMLGLGIVPGVYVITQFPQFANYPLSPAQGYLGIAVYVATVWLFYRTHRDLELNWSKSLELREGHALVTTGVYAYVRHPMYAAFWLMGVGQLLMLPNWIVGPAGLVGFGVLFFGRLRREEEMMIAAFGEEYRSYLRRTARVIPWIY
jgi:protein-S-isoprenylcysteine O-methyltransferase Ste14